MVPQVYQLPSTWCEHKISSPLRLHPHICPILVVTALPARLYWGFLMRDGGGMTIRACCAVEHGSWDLCIKKISSSFISLMAAPGLVVTEIIPDLICLLIVSFLS